MIIIHYNNSKAIISRTRIKLIKRIIVISIIRSIRSIRGQKSNPYSLPFREGLGVGFFPSRSTVNPQDWCFKCFKCFGCFRCFISLLDHKAARFWSKSEQTRQTARIIPAPYHGYGKHPKRQSTHLWWRIPNLPASSYTILSCEL